MTTQHKGKKKSTHPQWLKWAGIGSEMTAAIFICVFIGHFLDQRMNNATPWITIMMLFVGVAAAFYLVFKQLK